MRKSSIYDEQSAGYIGRPLIPSLRLSSSYWDADVAPIGAPEEWKDFETQQLFRVYGLRQFMRTGHVRPRDVHSVFVQGSFASRRLHHLWWPGGLSSSLVKRAMRGEPVTFAKAALMIAVVEAFVRDRERSVVIDDAEYRPLTIIPAIYTIDGIVGESAKTWMSNVALRREIDENLGHGAWRILPELLAGKVVTLITAKIVSTLLARFYPDGLFRSSRATSLRRAKAATHESVDELDPAAVSEEGVSYGAKRLD